MPRLTPEVLRAFVAVGSQAPSVTPFDTSKEIGQLMKQAADKAREEAMKRMIGGLTAVHEEFTSAKSRIGTTIAQAKADEANALETARTLDAAMAYGNRSGNYLPLLATLGLVTEADASTVGLSKAAWLAQCTIQDTPAQA
jgi:hypothetical protein